MIDEQISQYRIVSRLGSGGMGDVYRAEDLHLGRHVALKFLRREYVNEPAARERFEFEARAAAILNHPNITTLFEFNASLGFMSLELVEGDTFEDRLTERPMDPVEVVRVSLAVCRGLGHAHGRNVIHRDIKPSNILMDSAGSIKLTDFGLAKIRDVSMQATQDIVQGTPAYMAPEQISGSGMDRRGDLFALGVVIYRALAGRLPWSGTGMAGLLYSILEEDPAPLTEYQPDLIPEFASVVERLLKKEPEARYESAAEVEENLLEVEAILMLPPAVLSQRALQRPEKAAPEESAVKPAPTRDQFPFVGRKQEMQALKAALEATLGGAGRTILLGGTAGIGKSRLMEELSHEASAHRVLTLRGRCTFQGSRNFEPFIDALERFARGAETGGHKFLADLSPRHASLGSLLPTLKLMLDAGATDDATPRSREQLWFLLDTLLKSIAADVPFILFLEDLQWADEGTLSLLSHVTRNLAASPILVVGTYRPEELNDAEGRERPLGELLREHAATPTFQVLPLEPLPPDATAELLRASAPERWTKELSRTLHGRAQGNPLFTVELIRLFTTPEPERPAAGVDSGLEALPRTITDVLTRRLKRLTRDDRDILDAAAVEGEAFHAEVIEDALGLSRLKLLRRLRDLNETHQLIEPTPEGHRFTHGLIRETILNEMPADLKQEYHAAVGAYLIRGFADREDYAARIGMQLFSAGKPGEALPYLLRAAVEARRLFLNSRALELYDFALMALDAAGPAAASRSDVLRRRGEVLLLLGRFDQARAAAEAAFRQSEADGRPESLARSIELIGETALAQGDYGTAEEKLEEAFDQYTVLGDIPSLARCDRKLGSLATRRGDFDLAQAHFDSGLAALTALGDENGVAHIRLESSTVHFKRGDFDRALTELESGLEAFRSSGDRYGLEQGLNRAGNVSFQAGRTMEAVQRYADGLAIAEEIGDVQGMARLQANLGNVHLVRGESDRAGSAYQEALARFREIGDQNGVGQTLMALGNACFTRARFEEAADFYRRSLEPRRIMGDRWGLGNSLDNLSITEYFLGRWSEAWEHGVLARNLRQELKDRPGCTESALNLGNLMAVLGREAEARALYEEALSLAAEAADVRRQARAQLGLGCLDLRAAQKDAALSRCETVRNMQVEEPAISSRRLLIEALALANPGVPDPGGIIGGLVTAKLKAAMAAAEQAESLPDTCAVLLAEARELLARGEREEACRKSTDVLARVEGGRIPILEMVALGVLEAARSVEDDSIANRIEALARHLESQLPEGNGTLTDFKKPVFPLP